MAYDGNLDDFNGNSKRPGIKVILLLLLLLLFDSVVFRADALSILATSNLERRGQLEQSQTVFYGPFGGCLEIEMSNGPLINLKLFIIVYVFEFAADKKSRFSSSGLVVLLYLEYFL